MPESEDFFLSSYEYELKEELIAQKPIEPRHDARLLIVNGLDGNLAASSHVKVWDLTKELRRGDLLVLNDTRVLKARLRVRLSNGKLGELLLLEPTTGGKWLCLAKPAKKMRPGDYLRLEAPNKTSVRLNVIEKDATTGGRIVQFPSCYSDRASIESLLDSYGEVPLPPYIERLDSVDEERYQTRYASKPGAVAAPTAGLHLSDELLKELEKKGVLQARITLHVGLGTFRPLENKDLSNLELHSEWVEVSPEVVEAISSCRLNGGRVMAIGTTTVRALESAFLKGNSKLKPFVGKVNLVIKPGFKFGIVDGLLTNFHLPKSSLLLLVSAMIGRKRLLALYSEAIKRKYRFFSYGDAMWIPPEAILLEARPH